MEPEGEVSSNFAYDILKNLKENNERTILVVDGEAVTGLDMHQRVSAAVHLLLKSGVAPGNRVLITMAPSVDFFALIVAAFVVGGCMVVLDTEMGLEYSNHCITTAKPAVWILSQGSWLKYLKFLVPSLHSITIQLEINSLASYWTQHSNTAGVETPVGGSDNTVRLVEPEDCVPVQHALVTFTTGSTGMPKLMLRKHSFLLNQSRSMSLSYEKILRQELGFGEREYVACANLPMFSLHFLKIGVPNLLFTSIAKCDPANVMDTMKKYKALGLGGSPAFVHKIASYAVKQNTVLPVKVTQIGGAPIYRGVLRTIASVTPNRKAYVVYGSTEVEPVSAISAVEKMSAESDKPDGLCVGRPVFENSARVIGILSEPPSEPVDMDDLELPRGEIGEIVVSGWHVNTYQVDSKRLLTDLQGKEWLRIEDAGYMDSEGRLWLVGRVKWRVEREGKTFWSTVVEQKILDRCSVLTFTAYLPHNEEAWLFLEAPQGLPDKEETALKQYLLREGIPVDHFIVRTHIPKDRRHLSKPNTAVLFAPSSIQRYMKLAAYLLRSNPLLILLVILIQLVIIFSVVFLIVMF